MGNLAANPMDVLVIGGGPAGSTAAALIAGAGHRVRLIDRGVFPRWHIGESLMPATYWSLKRLGVLDRMNSSRFPRKQSVQFFAANGRSSAPFYFPEFDPHESSISWQVDRADFDEMLLDNAKAAGVDVHVRTNVKELLFEGEQATGALVEYEDGRREESKARVVVDASGQSGLFSRKLKLKNDDPRLRHAAFFTRYRGARRDTGIDEGATLVLQTEAEGCWFWYIPLPENRVSVGVVGPVGHLLRGRNGDPQRVYNEEARKCPALLERIANADQIMEVRVMRDFSYISHRIAGDGWIMAGDAFGFLDPIYSTGVFLAMKSAEFAADAVNASLAANDLSARSLSRYGETYVAGMEAMRKLVYAYYDQEFSFPKFLERFPDCKDELVNLLIGNVFRNPPRKLFDSMAQMCELPVSRTLLAAEDRVES